MLDNIYNAIDWVVSFFENILTFIANFFDGLFTALILIANSITFPLSLTLVLPSFLVSAVLCVVAVAVLKFCINR